MTILWEVDEKHPKQVSAYGTWSWVGFAPIRESRLQRLRSPGIGFFTTSAFIRLERVAPAGFPDRENCLDPRQPSESVVPIQERCVRAVTERWLSILRTIPEEQ